MNCDGMFQPETLSFDSNLDSLIDADFNTDIELPFPSHSQMSALVTEGVDLIVSEGGGGVETANDLPRIETSGQPQELISSGSEILKEQVSGQNASMNNFERAISDSRNSGTKLQETEVINTKDDCRLVKNMDTEIEGRINVTNVHNIEHLNLKSLKEKRKKKLAKNANTRQTNMGEKTSQDTKPENSHYSQQKKRKYVESSETPEVQNDVSKKLKNLSKVGTPDRIQTEVSEGNKNIIIGNEVNLNKNLNNASPDSPTDIKVVSLDSDLEKNQIVEDCNTEKRSKEVSSFEEEYSEDKVDEEAVKKLDGNPEVMDVSESTITENEENKAMLTEIDMNMADEGETAAVCVDDDEDGVDDDDSDSDDEFDENEVDAWLEEGVKKGERKTETEVSSEKELGNGNYMTKQKYILQEKGANPFEVLPEGWVMVIHNSGMPVYLHKPSRVCTMSRPYFIGRGSVRKHEIPISAVPCLQYRRELDKENKQQQAKQGPSDTVQNDQTDRDGGSAELPTPIVATAEAVDKEVVLNPEALYTYCKSLFQFRTITVKKFQTWREKRNHLRQKYEQERKLPKMAADTKLIVCPIPESVSKTFSKKKKDFVINPEGKSAVCILHEYTQHVIRVQPVYTFTEIENQETPYKATIMIDNVGYGSGLGSCKKKAKLEAAKSALKVFIPQLAEYWKEAESKTQNIDLSYFEEVSIEDPRVTTLCDKAALPKPYQVLSECLKRNFGMGDTNLRIEKRLVSNQKTEFSLTVGKHKATVVCKNKLEGKQKAAQCMLKILHPQLKSWASILRLYSKNTEVGFQEREEEIAETPGMKDGQLLEKLKEAMRKTKAMKLNCLHNMISQPNDEVSVNFYVEKWMAETGFLRLEAGYKMKLFK